MISIIIPVLNEELYIGKLLEHLLANSLAKNISEIIVVDGGSTDNTKHIVQAFSNFTQSDSIEAFNFIDDTVLEDNPQLNARDFKGNNPIRIVLDKSGKVTNVHFVNDQKTKTGGNH